MIITKKEFPNYRKYEMDFEGRPLSMEVGKLAELCNAAVLVRYGEGGKAEWVYVHTVRANSESYAVTANTDRGATLEEGDRVIVSGNLNLADGSKVVLKQ